MDYILGGAIGFILAAMIFSAVCNEDKLKRDAVKYGCASYVVTDSLRGAVEFQWKAK